MSTLETKNGNGDANGKIPESVIENGNEVEFEESKPKRKETSKSGGLFSFPRLHRVINLSSNNNTDQV